jgi:hypothetical protein
MLEAAFHFARFNDLLGHTSYAIFALSFLLKNITWLRILMIVGLGFEIAYFFATSGDMYTGIGWNLAFISINLYRLGDLYGGAPLCGA